MNNLIQLNTNDQTGETSNIFCVDNDVLESLEKLTTKGDFLRFSIDHISDDHTGEKTPVEKILKWLNIKVFLFAIITPKDLLTTEILNTITP